MQVITDLNDRDLYAPLRTYLDLDHEPMAGPRDPLPRIQPAEAATDVGVDQDTLPKEPTTPAERIYIAALWAVAGYFTGSVGSVIGRALGWW